MVLVLLRTAHICWLFFILPNQALFAQHAMYCPNWQCLSNKVSHVLRHNKKSPDNPRHPQIYSLSWSKFASWELAMFQSWSGSALTSIPPEISDAFAGAQPSPLSTPWESPSGLQWIDPISGQSRELRWSWIPVTRSLMGYTKTPAWTHGHLHGHLHPGIHMGREVAPGSPLPQQETPPLAQALCQDHSLQLAREQVGAWWLVASQLH